MRVHCLVLLAALLPFAVACSAAPKPTSPPLASQTGAPQKPTALPTTAPPGSPTPAAIPAPDLSAIVKPGDPVFPDPQQADQSERAILDQMREMSGIRALFGDQADATFRNADQARAAAIQKMTRDLRLSEVRPNEPGSAFAAVGGGGKMIAAPAAQGPATGFGLSFLSHAPDLMATRPEYLDANGRAVVPPKEENQTTQVEGAQVQTYTKTSATQNGSRLEIEFEMTVKEEEPGRLYDEKMTGKLAVDMCPDAQGTVHLDYSFTTGLSGSKSGSTTGPLSMQTTSTGTATGHVNDDGQFQGYASEMKLEGAQQTLKAGSPLNQYMQWTYQLNADGANSVTSAGIDPTRWSSQVEADFVYAMVKMLDLLNHFVVYFAFNTARGKWEKGYCLRIVVPEIKATETTQVPVGSVTPFTAKVQHNVEKKELPLPVIATLTGAKTVSPSQAKVPAPAKFTYQAGDKGGEEATVHLETRSRRGIAQLDLTFLTRDAPDADVLFSSKIAVTYKVKGGPGYNEGQGTFETEFNIHLTKDPATDTLKGSGQLTYKASQYREVVGLAGSGECTIRATGGTHPATVNVTATRYGLSDITSTPDIELEIDFGKPTENYATECNPAFLKPKTEPDLHWWINGFAAMHLKEYRGAEFVVNGFGIPQPDTDTGYFLVKSWNNSVNPAFGSGPNQTIGYDENTVIKVKYGER